MRNLPKLLSKLPAHFQWSLHNLIAHPLSEVLHLVGCPERWGNWVHDITVPEHEPGTGRG